MYKISRDKFNANINAPISKSYLHRALILASIRKDGKKTKLITNTSHYQDDILSTIDCLRKIGSDIVINKTYIEVNPILKINKEIEINVLESGTTLRFILSLIAALNIKAKIYGKGIVLKRPSEDLFEMLVSAGSKIEKYDDYIYIEGNIDDNKTYKINASVSSQFISGLLLVLTLKNNVKIKTIGNIVSKSYIQLTLNILKEFGYIIDFEDIFYIKNIKEAKTEINVESDWSSVVSILGLSIFNKVKINNLFFNSVQADKKILDILNDFNAILNRDKDSLEIEITNFDGIDIDIDEMPDIAPILSSILIYANTKSRILNTKRLKIKESDREEEIVKMLSQVSDKIECKDNVILIEPIKRGEKKNLIYEGKDHRIAMAYVALLQGLSKDSTLFIKYPECTQKSYYGYFDELRKIGFKIEEL